MGSGNQSFDLIDMKTVRIAQLIRPLVLAALWLSPAPPAPAAEAPSPLDLARQLNQAFADVAEQVSPAVVVIKVAQRPTLAEPG